MAEYDIYTIAWQPTAGLLGSGDTVRYLANRARGALGDADGVLLGDDEINAAYRGVCEIARATLQWMGEAIVCMQDAERAVFRLPAGFIELAGAAQYGGSTLDLGTLRAASGGSQWFAQKGTPTTFQLVNPQEFMLTVKPSAATTKTFHYDSVAGTISDGTISTTSIATADTTNGIVTLRPTYTNRKLFDQWYTTDNLVRMWYVCEPSFYDFDDSTLIDRSFSQVLQDYLIWEMARVGDDEEDQKLAKDAENRWRAVLEQEANRAKMRREFPDGLPCVGMPE